MNSLASLYTKYQSSKLFYIFLLVWMAVNLLQSGFTSLNNDEAYYWMYSQYPAWGYFDHPPMIAFMIRAGYLLIHNELGVRLLTVLFSAASLMILWSLIEDSGRKHANIGYFIILAVALPVFNLYGFIATPDSPLLFFSLLFLMAYKRFLAKETWLNAAFISITMAAMMYSKYHAALLIIFVILSNLKLLMSTRFWLATLLAVVLFVPHLHWQFTNDFPSIRYHLVDRVAGLNPENIPAYIGNLLAFQNPVILTLAIWLTIIKKPGSKFERALYFIMYGFMIFFLVESFRYNVQPQWTALMALPILLIVFSSVDLKPGIAKTVRWGTYIMLPVIIAGRSALIFDFLPVSFLKDEFHDYRKKVIEIAEIAKERPVVFTNSYQDPSIYTFYTGKFAHSLDNLNYRRTQYDLWNFEERIHGKEVLYVPHWPTTYIQENFTRHLFFNGDSVYMKIYSDFRSLQKECVILKDDQYIFRENSLNTLNVDIFNPYPYPIEIQHREFPVNFYINFFIKGSREERWALQLPDSISIIEPGDTISVDCRFSLGRLNEKAYKIVITSEAGVLYDAFNSRFKDAAITDD